MRNPTSAVVESSSANGNGSSNPTANVRVYCRVRPQNAMEQRKASGEKCVLVDGNTIEVKPGSCDGIRKFTFDCVFSEDDGQSVVFDKVARPVVQDLMDGYNATIFAYGQTSSGKTYTMEGASIDDEQLRGVIPRTATELFTNVMNADENLEFIVKISYIEIYMERIRDLLDPYKSKVNLQVREDAERGIFVEGMTEICVTSSDELLAAMRDGARNRAVAATGMNEGSSRSHSVFMVTLYQRNLANQATKTGKLYLVDLAGSEMVRKTGAAGKQLEEAKMINKSLSALGMVINALTDGNAAHIPYRDSKLTRMLQESLGGNSRTALIINVSPSTFNALETVSTLRFGHRAKSIKNKAVVNEQRSVEEYKILLTQAEKKISSLQNQVLSLKARLGGNEPPGTESGDAVTERTEDDKDNETAAKTAAMDPGSALEKLQNRVTQLEEELAEEKQESARRAQEICALTAQLEEQRQLYETASCSLDQLTKGNLQATSSLEEQIRSKENLLEEIQAEMDKLKFDHEELRIHAETVQHEYDTLVQDLTINASKSPSKNTILANAMAHRQSPLNTSIDDAGHTTASDISSITSPSASPVKSVSSSAGAGAANTSSDESDGDEVEEEAHANKTVNTGTNATESPTQHHDDAQDSWKAKCKLLQDELRKSEKDHRLYQVNSETDKARLQEELERKKAHIREMELQLDKNAASLAPNASVNGNNVLVNSGMTPRERQHMRSIQQKLEQLVAVHRQLLRKYASLELELSEAKKKLILRDDRIKQVESNNRLLAGNMRAQAEKHVEELSTLRDQIADFRGAQRSHFEAQMGYNNNHHHNSNNNNNSSSSSSTSTTATTTGSSIDGTKSLRGGIGGTVSTNTLYGDGIIRPIRGGGRKKNESLGPDGTPNSTNSTNATYGTGFLTRFFGRS